MRTVKEFQAELESRGFRLSSMHPPFAGREFIYTANAGGEEYSIVVTLYYQISVITKYDERKVLFANLSIQRNGSTECFSPFYEENSLLWELEQLVPVAA